MSYYQLTKYAECEKYLEYRGILDLHLFRSYRNRVIHDIIFEKNIDYDLLEIWFNFGREVNQRIERLTNEVWYKDWHSRTDEDPLDFY